MNFRDTEDAARASCLHATAYRCAECNRSFCMSCDARQPDDREVKTAVRWCPYDIYAEAAANGLPVDTMRRIRLTRGDRVMT